MSELKYLKNVHALLTDEAPTIKGIRRFELLLKVMSALSIAVGCFLIRPWDTWEIVGMLLIGIAGAGFGVASYMSVNVSNWRYLRPHIEQKSVEQRISQLDT